MRTIKVFILSKTLPPPACIVNLPYPGDHDFKFTLFKDAWFCRISQKCEKKVNERTDE